MDTYHDLETRSRYDLIKGGSDNYGRHPSTEILLWAFAVEDGDIFVWDRLNRELWIFDDLIGGMRLVRTLGDQPPSELLSTLRDEDALVWFHNARFDFGVIDHRTDLGALVPVRRRRDTMIQAYAHSMPGSLDALGAALGLAEDQQKKKTGKSLIRLFCIPNKDGNFNDRSTHPAQWAQFIEYACGDIVTMRIAHKKLPMWNYKGKQVELWHTDLRINARGFLADVALAEAAIRASDAAKAGLAKQAQEITDGAVQSTTQRDATLRFLLAEHGVDLPDLRADTLERRIDDPDLPEPVKELLRNRLQASMNSVAKYKVVLRVAGTDNRIRGGFQFRGAARTGRWAHRMVQMGNLPRSTLPASFIETGIEALKTDCADLITDNVQELCSNALRGILIAPPGRKLVVADLSNIEGRMAAWLAGEDWKLQAFRDYDAGIGPDLYVRAYAASFNVDPKDVTKANRQIGKIQELMLQYGGGVGAFITGAATYGIDLNHLAEVAWPNIPERIVRESADFLKWVTDKAKTESAKTKARHGLADKTFIVCDSLKRLWREAHPAISSYWRELEDATRAAINTPGHTFACRRVKIRRDGAWLRIQLPSGRSLCYPSPNVDDNGAITYVGVNQYSRCWERIHTYGGKELEQCTQGASADQFAECMPIAEEVGYELVSHVHDEYIAETPDDEQFNPEDLGRLMCSDLGWNAGLPLAAAGFEDYRYRKD